MSPWVRLQEHVLDHPKLLGLVDLRRPFDLWIWGLSYAQKHLTDGVLPLVALPRGADKAAQQLIDRGLWESSDGSYLIHDYHDWNESRETVLSKRSAAKVRAKKARTYTARARERAPHGAVGSVSRSSSLPEREFEGKPKSLASVSEELAQRAADFIEKYSELFSKHRKGAKILRRQPALDWDRACQLCRTWSDDRLVKLAEIFLTSDEEWIVTTDRGFSVFCARATWCDERLAAWEASHPVPA